jgi:perosamine synthetase
VRRKLALLGGTTTSAELRAAARQLARGGLVDGPALPAYERAFAAAAGTRFARALATARVGLFALLRALGVGPGDEVLLGVPTHIVVANAIRYTGAQPVYADCLPGNWNLDLARAAARVSSRTRVLIVQHTFGVPVDLDAARAFADAHELVLLEDGVHALGATWRGRPVGSFGRAAFFSTEETKVISTTMGGMVVTDDPELDAALARFQAQCAPPPRGEAAGYLLKLGAYHALTQPEVHVLARGLYERLGRRHPLPVPTQATELEGGPRAGYRQRLSNAQAAVGLEQLRRLPEILGHRRAVAARYAEVLSGRGCPGPAVPDGAEPAWVRYPIRVQDREAAMRALEPHVVVGTWFSSVLEEADAPERGGYVPGSCPVAEDAARHLVNLPTHPRVALADAERLAALVPCPAPG